MSTSAESRCASSTTTRPSSSRSPRSSPGERTAWPAVMIAVSGVRRSCDTARSSAVLMTSERRSACVSTTSACSRSRSSAARSSASSAGATRSRTRARIAASSPPGPSSSSASWPLPRSSFTPRRASASLGGIEHDLDVAQAERRADEPPRLGQRVGERRPAEQDARGAGREVGFAATALGLGGARAREIRDGRRHRRGHEEHAQRHPVRRVGDHQPAGGRDVEEVERRGAQRGSSTGRRPSRGTRRRAAPRAGRRPPARPPARSPQRVDRRASSPRPRGRRRPRPKPSGERRRPAAETRERCPRRTSWTTPRPPARAGAARAGLRRRATASARACP